MEEVNTTLRDRIGIGAVLLLLVAFVFAVASPFASSAGADDSVAGKRDDDVREVAVVSDDDDDDDSNSGAGGSESGSAASAATAATPRPALQPVRACRSPYRTAPARASTPNRHHTRHRQVEERLQQLLTPRHGRAASPRGAARPTTSKEDTRWDSRSRLRNRSGSPSASPTRTRPSLAGALRRGSDRPAAERDQAARWRLPISGLPGVERASALAGRDQGRTAGTGPRSTDPEWARRRGRVPRPAQPPGPAALLRTRDRGTGHLTGLGQARSTRRWTITRASRLVGPRIKHRKAWIRAHCHPRRWPDRQMRDLSGGSYRDLMPHS